MVLRYVEFFNTGQCLQMVKFSQKGENDVSRQIQMAEWLVQNLHHNCAECRVQAPLYMFTCRSHDFLIDNLIGSMESFGGKAPGIIEGHVDIIPSISMYHWVSRADLNGTSHINVQQLCFWNQYWSPTIRISHYSMKGTYRLVGRQLGTYMGVLPGLG